MEYIVPPISEWHRSCPADPFAEHVAFECRDPEHALIEAALVEQLCSVAP